MRRLLPGRRDRLDRHGHQQRVISKVGLVNQNQRVFLVKRFLLGLDRGCNRGFWLGLDGLAFDADLAVELVEFLDPGAGLV